MAKQIALVTGASRGIGRAIAERLADDDFFVVGTATSDGGADSISDYLGENGKGIKLDVADIESIAEVIMHGASSHDLTIESPCQDRDPMAPPSWGLAD